MSQVNQQDRITTVTADMWTNVFQGNDPNNPEAGAVDGMTQFQNILAFIEGSMVTTVVNGNGRMLKLPFLEVAMHSGIIEPNMSSGESTSWVWTFPEPFSGPPSVSGSARHGGTPVSRALSTGEGTATSRFLSLHDLRTSGGGTLTRWDAFAIYIPG